MRRSMQLSASLCAVLLLGARAASAQPHTPPQRDLTGIWTLASLTEMERPKAFKTLVIIEAEAQAFEKLRRNTPPDYATEADPTFDGTGEWWERDVGLARIRGQARTSWIVSPADGQRPLNAAAKASEKARDARRRIDFADPETRDRSERCIDSGAGPPLTNGGANDLYQLVLAGDQLAIHAEWLDDLRVVRIGDTHHLPPQIRVLGGDSIAHWEGATLVVETTNFAPSDVRDPKGDPAADMKTVERLTRLSPQELFYEITVADPFRDSQTWKAEMVFQLSKKPMYEYACHEGNYALTNILAGHRRLEGRTVDGVAAGGR
jgi:hypothetical protein